MPVGVIDMARQPREARSGTAHTRLRQDVSPGSRPITFTRWRVSPKVRSMKLECRIRRVVLDWETQVTGQLFAVGEQALDRGRVDAAVLRGEGVEALLNRNNQLGPGRDAGGDQVVGVEDRPVGVTQLALRLGAHLGEDSRTIGPM